MIKLPIKIGDYILRGKFRNKKVRVNTIGIDEHGSPTVNGKSILSIRLMPKEDQEDLKLSKVAKEIISKNKK